MQKQTGQSLIEVLVALSVTLIMIVALIAFVLSGLKNAQFAQSQSKATKLAQETMEQIKTIRDRNGSVSFTYSGTSTNNFLDLWNINMSRECNPVGSTSGPCYFQLNNFILTGDAGNLLAKDTLENQFTRQILLEDTAIGDSYKTEKKVTVIVKWTDSTGEHESNIQTILKPVL